MPCWVTYVLQVSQMVLETDSMELCAGRFLVWMYCKYPKARPITHTSKPT